MFINLQISSFWDANYFLFQNLPPSLTLCFLFLFSLSSILSLSFCPTSYYLQIKSFSNLQPYLKSFYLLTLVALQKQQNTTKTKTKTLHNTKTKTKTKTKKKPAACSNFRKWSYKYKDTSTWIKKAYHLSCFS